MVRLNKIYTRTGDDGSTGLGSGERRPKHDPRIDACGVVDEANCAIGLARLHGAEDGGLDGMLARVQNDLFDLGADLAVPDVDPKPEFEALRITDGQVARLERDIDALNARLEPLRSFILPAGSALSAHLHMARATARRAERAMVALAALETVGGPALRYINRLSDLLFVAARIANDDGRADVLWVPGESR
jgi:cob(I)alamin adenosyltransferase